MPMVVSSDPNEEQLPDEEEDMVQLLASNSVKGTKSLNRTFWKVGGFALLVLTAGPVLLALLKVGATSGVSSQPPAPSTVRGVLEGSELADIATDNVMAMYRQPPSSRPATLEHVSRGLLEVSSTIKKLAPEAHHQLEDLELTSKQKDEVLDSVRKFGDSRLVDLTHDITDAFRENRKNNGTHRSLMMHLSKKLRPKIEEVQALHDEMMVKVPALDKWHGRLKVDFGDRRLAAATAAGAKEMIDPSVRAQAHALFRAVQVQLGDSMPEEPARLLLASSTTKTTDDKKNSAGVEEGLIQCIEDAWPSLMDACACIKDDLETILAKIKHIFNRAEHTIEGGRL